MTKTDKPKVIVIGFDGASWNYINPLIKEGWLTNFEYLVKNGVTATMKSTIPPVTVPAWQCMFSGYNPGYIGAVDFKRRVDNFRFELVSPKMWKGFMIWDRLKSVKMLVMNIPFTYPPYEINGHMVPLEFTPEFGHTYPPELVDELDKKFSIRSLSRIENVSDPKKRIEILYEINKVISEMFIYLVKKYKYDLSIVRFSIPDLISHQTTNIDELKKSYKFIDELLGKLLEEFGGMDYIFFLVSDHGLEYVTKRICINYILYKDGFLKLNSKGKIYLFMLKFLTPIIEKWREEVIKILNRIYKRDFTMPGVDDLFKYLDLKKTLAFTRHSVGFRQFPIYLTINPESCEYNKVRNEIISCLRNIKSPNEEKIISKIWKREELYKGSYLKFMPDLIVESKYCLFVPLIGKAFLNMGTFTHSPDAIFIAYGRDIRKGVSISKVEIFDLAPTIYYLFEHPIPNDIDGHVLLNIFEKELVNKPIKYVKYNEKTLIKSKIRKLSARKTKKLDHNDCIDSKGV